jgi:hypothetical protein
MSAIASRLQQFAVQEAEDLKAAEARIEQEIGEIEEIVAGLKARREVARVSRRRLLDYSAGPGPGHLCPRCWGHQDAKTALAEDAGALRCPVCGFRIAAAGA